jgi:hypothetical protein
MSEAQIVSYNQYPFTLTGESGECVGSDLLLQQNDFENSQIIELEMLYKVRVKKSVF